MREQNRLVRCDTCGMSFNMDGVTIHEERLTRNRTGMFFVCPLCGTKYPFASITERGKNLRRMLQKSVERAGVAEGTDKLPLFEEHDKLLKKYQQEVTGPYSESEVLAR